MATIPWETCADDFQWDGSWRDIYVLPTTFQDWEVVYPLLRKQADIEFIKDGAVCDIPEKITPAFFSAFRPTLRFRVGEILVVCHFFSLEQIEFDIDPREVTSQARLNSLLAFLQQLGDRLQKFAVLTPENSLETPIIIYDPKKQGFEHHPRAL